MIIKTSLGFSVSVDSDGRFQLPDRSFTTTDLKKVARDISRAIRKSEAEIIDGMLCGNEGYDD